MCSVPFQISPFLLLVLILVLGIVSPTLAQDDGFKLDPGCTLPFADIAPAQDPFQACGDCGVVSATAKPAQVRAKAFESKAKNNFCGDSSAVIVVDF
jgi:hypothetical protein